MIGLSLSFDQEHTRLLQRLPWWKPLTEWHNRDASFLEVKSGLSRHPVRFVKVGRKAFAE